MLRARFLDLIKRERLLFKLISSFLAASVVSVVLVSGILFAAYNRRSMEDLAAVTQMSLAEIANRMERMFTQAADIAFLIFKNPDVVSLMYANGEDPLNLVRVTGFVQNLMISDPYIDSVSLCGRETVLLSTSQSGVTAEPSDVILNLARLPKVLTPKPRQVERTHGRLDSLLTLTISDSNSPSYVDSAVVVNLDADAIRADLATDTAAGLQTIVVVDAAGTVLLGADGVKFGTSIAEEPFAKLLAADPRASGSFLTNVKDRRYVVSFARVSDGHYSAISLTDYARYTAGISGLRTILLAASGGILVVILAFGLFLSLRLYVPLNALFDGIRSRISTPLEPKANELEYVSRILARAMDTFSAAEHAVSNDRMVVSALLRDLLTGPVGPDTRALEEELRRRNVIPAKPGRFSIALLRVDGFAALREKSSPEAIRFQVASIGGIAAETLGSRVACIPTETGDGLVALLLFIPDSAARWWESRAQGGLRGVQDAVRKVLGLSITVGLGSDVPAISEAHALYGRVEALTHYTLAFSRGAIITPADVQRFKDEPADVRGIEESFRSLARSGDRDAFAHAVDGLVRTCAELRFERQAEAFTAAARGVSTSGVGVAPQMAEGSTIGGVESYDELKGRLLELFDAHHKLLTELSTSKSADFLRKAIEFVDRNYADHQLSANMLAEKLAITPQYFSRLFNESVGSSFPEYLMGLRLEKARALLLSAPRMTTDEICRHVGLNNRTYFATAFKKRYGLSPATFRQAGASASLSVPSD
jgi:two-component system, response regulator YesN